MTLAFDRNWYAIRLSVISTLSSGLSVFASIDSTFEHAYLDDYGFSIGVRRGF